MQLLLVSEEQVSASETPGALVALERLLFRMGSLMTLQMFESGEASATFATDVWPGFVGLR